VINFNKNRIMTMAPQAIDAIVNLAAIIDADLKRNEIESILSLLVNGVHPDALAALILELRRSAAR
jgi:dTDP-4-dehydrorhamnose reductase